MCGIAGFWDPAGLNHDAQAVIRRMTDAIRHRGPDGEGDWLDPDAGIALGHRRLAILDLSSAGAQPMESPSGRYVLTFNGELYNWRDLRAVEEVHGARWRGHSDTEVFLALCDRVGIRAAVQQSAGMFAMGIWDRRDRALTLVRDRIGEKPLYYGWCNGVLLFGSELKALRAHPGFVGTLDRGALTLYMRHSYVPGPYSIYAEISKLPPGTTATFRGTPGVLPDPEPYWSLREVAERGQADPHHGSTAEVAEELERLLLRVVGEQMVADVPLGAFLSGGIDSSLIAALMQAQSSRPVKTFTIGFHEAAFNEATYAKDVATHLGTEHTELYVTPQQALDVIPKLPAIYDEPFADSSQIPTFLVAQMTREHVTVALSGDGGDEAFGGYDRYALAPALVRFQSRLGHIGTSALSRAILSLSPAGLDRLTWLVPGKRRYSLTGDRLHKLAHLLRHRGEGPLYRALISNWAEPRSVVHEGVDLSTPMESAFDWSDAGYESRMMLGDGIGYLPDDVMVKVDRAAMAVHLEARAPLVHHAVLEYAWRLPARSRRGQGGGKQVLRDILSRYVPSALIDRPKSGFGVPLSTWLRGPLAEWAEALVSGTALEQMGLDRPIVERMVHEHISGSRNWQYQLWPVLMLAAWLHAE